MKIQIFLILLFIETIINDVPTYTLIKGSEPLNFKFNDKNSTFYAYLNYEEDFESENTSFSELHFIKIDKRLNYKFDWKKGDFPDESEFNKDFHNLDDNKNVLDINDDIRLFGYYTLSKEEVLIFAFYLKDEYLDSFNTEDSFKVEKIYSSFYIEQKIYDFNFKPDELRLFKVNITRDSYFKNQLIYINLLFLLYILLMVVLIKK